MLKVQTGVLLIYDRYPDFADDGLSGSRIEGKYGLPFGRLFHGREGLRELRYKEDILIVYPAPGTPHTGKLILPSLLNPAFVYIFVIHIDHQRSLYPFFIGISVYPDMRGRGKFR